jgi:hypothetical protein
LAKRHCRGGAIRRDEGAGDVLLQAGSCWAARQGPTAAVHRTSNLEYCVCAVVSGRPSLHRFTLLTGKGRGRRPRSPLVRPSPTIAAPAGPPTTQYGVKALSRISRVRGPRIKYCVRAASCFFAAPDPACAAPRTVETTSASFTTHHGVRIGSAALPGLAHRPSAAPGLCPGRPRKVQQHSPVRAGRPQGPVAIPRNLCPRHLSSVVHVHVHTVVQPCAPAAARVQQHAGGPQAPKRRPLQPLAACPAQLQSISASTVHAGLSCLGVTFAVEVCAMGDSVFSRPLATATAFAMPRAYTRAYGWHADLGLCNRSFPNNASHSMNYATSSPAPTPGLSGNTPVSHACVSRS